MWNIIKDNGFDLFFVTETWLSAQGDEAKTAELAPSGFDVKSFLRQSRSRGGGIATVYKSTLGSNITFKTNFDFTHTSFEVVQASITLQHNTLHFFCLYRPPPNRRNNLTDSMFTEQLPDLLDYVNSLPGFVCLVGDMNIHFDNPLQSLTKQTLSTLSLYSLVKVINVVVRMSILDTKGRRFEPQHQYVFSLSKRLYPHCFSRLTCEMSTRWGQPREGCSVLWALRRNST